MNYTAMKIAVSACAVLALTAASAGADDTTPAADNSASATSDMKVARDKETGKLRPPTEEESAALEAKGRTMNSSNVVVVSRPTSTVEYRTDGSAVGKRSLEEMDDLTLTRTPDGKDVLGHSGDSATADEPAPKAPVQDLPQE